MDLRFKQTMLTLPRLCLTIVFSVLFIPISFSQTSGNYKRDSIDLTRISELPMYLDIPTGKYEITPVIFKSIRVEDVRFDTTHIGIYSVFKNVLGPSLKSYRINLDGGLRNSLHNFLNPFFKPLPTEEDMELVCFVKTLSVIRKDTIVENESLQYKYGQVNFGAEVFLRSGSNFYAAIKIDTVLYSVIGTREKQISDDMRDYLLIPVFQLLRNEISHTKWESILRRTVFTEKTVRNHYFTERFDIPVLTQPCKKGIYRSFLEFKNNRPYISDFKVKKEKFNTIFLVDNEGNYIPTTKLFGFCDGEKYWILRGNYRFPMFRVCNGFEFFFSLGRGLKLLMALDMEKGKIY